MSWSESLGASPRGKRSVDPTAGIGGEDPELWRLGRVCRVRDDCCIESVPAGSDRHATATGLRAIVPAATYCDRADS